MSDPISLEAMHLCIRRFCEEQRTSSRSAYVEAIASAIDLVLDEFPLSPKKAEPQQLRSLMSRIYALSIELCGEEAIGGAVLDTIRRHCDTGFHHAFCVLSRMWIHFGHGLLLHQLRSWMYMPCPLSSFLILDRLHAQLVSDPHDEFFIQKAFVHGPTECIPMLFDSWNARYKVALRNLASYVSTITAKKVLFIGRAAEIINPHFQNSIMEQILARLAIHEEGMDNSKFLWLDHSDTFHNFSKERHYQSIRSIDFVVSEAYQLTAHNLWGLVQDKGNLIGILEAFRGFFFLGYGEVYETFVNSCDSFLPRANTQSHSRNMNELSKAFVTSVIEAQIDDQFANRFSLEFNLCDAKTHITPSKCLLFGDAEISETKLGVSLGFLRRDINLANGTFWDKHRITATHGLTLEFLLNIHGMAESSITLGLYDDAFAEILDLSKGLRLTLNMIGAAPWLGSACANEGEDDEDWCQVSLRVGGDCCRSTDFIVNGLIEPLRIIVKYDPSQTSTSVVIKGNESQEEFCSLTMNQCPKVKNGWLGIGALREHRSDVSFELIDIEVREHHRLKNAYNWESDFWDRSTLNFDFDSSVESVFFSVQNLEMYGNVYRVLMRLYYVHHLLKKIMFDHKEYLTGFQFKEEKPHEYTVLKRLALIRHKMQFVVQHIILLLQVEVVDEAFVNLKNSVDRTVDFESARKVHEEYLKQIHTAFGDVCIWLKL